MQQKKWRDDAYDYQSFDFEVVHWGGIKNQAAKALSRSRTTETEEFSLNYDLVVLRITEVHPEGEKTEMDPKLGIVSPVIKEWTR